MKSSRIRIDKLTVHLCGVTPHEARGRGASIARDVAAAVACQGGAMPGAPTRIDRLTLRTSSAFEPQIQRQWKGK
jgi:hypothetical protein